MLRVKPDKEATLFEVCSTEDQHVTNNSNEKRKFAVTLEDQETFETLQTLQTTRYAIVINFRSVI